MDLFREIAEKAWPVPEAVPEEFFLQPDGRLDDAPPAVADDEARGHSSYVYDGAGLTDPDEQLAGFKAKPRAT